MQERFCAPGEEVGVSYGAKEPVQRVRPTFATGGMKAPRVGKRGRETGFADELAELVRAAAGGAFGEKDGFFAGGDAGVARGDVGVGEGADAVVVFVLVDELRGEVAGELREAEVFAGEGPRQNRRPRPKGGRRSDRRWSRGFRMVRRRCRGRNACAAVGLWVDGVFPDNGARVSGRRRVDEHRS